MSTQDTLPPLEQERAAFEAFCFERGLMSASHGLMSVSSHCDTAWLAWQARAAIAQGKTELQQLIADNAGRAAFLDSHPAVTKELCDLIEENERLKAALAAQAPQQTDREAFMAGYEAAQADAARCDLPPMGWVCTRKAGHEGPCAAVEDADSVELVRRGMERLREPQQAQGAPLLEQVTQALETAKSGLLWYQDRCKDAVDGSDDEAMDEIDRAIETCHQLAAAPQAEPQTPEPAPAELGPDSENYAGDEAPPPADVPYPPSLDIVTIYNAYGPMSMDPTDGQPVQAYWDREGLRDYGARCIAWAATQAPAVEAEPQQAQGVPTAAQILTACEEAGLWPNTAASWVSNGAFARYHAAINRMIAAAPQAAPAPKAEPQPVARVTEFVGAARITAECLPHTGALMKIGDMLYAGPVQAGAVEPQATPAPAPQALTDEQLRGIHHEDEFGLFCDFDEFEQIARAVEHALGIRAASAGGEG